VRRVRALPARPDVARVRPWMGPRAFAGPATAIPQRDAAERPRVARRATPQGLGDTSALGLDVVGFDTEWVGVGRNTVSGGTGKALARMSIVAPGGRVLLDTTVRVLEPVADFHIDLTGLTQESIDEGIPFEEARAWALHLFHGRIVVGHNLKGDWQVLDHEPPADLVRDTAKYRPLRASGMEKKLPKLSELAAAWLGESVQVGFHDSVEDARTALELYLLHRERWEASVHEPAAAAQYDCRYVPAAPMSHAPVDAGARVARAVALAAECPNKDLVRRWHEITAAAQAKPNANTYAVKHYQRIGKTLAALPYAVSCERHLGRPELRCIGKEGSKSHKLLAGLLRELADA